MSSSPPSCISGAVGYELFTTSLHIKSSGDVVASLCIANPAKGRATGLSGFPFCLYACRGTSRQTCPPKSTGPRPPTPSTACGWPTAWWSSGSWRLLFQVRKSGLHARCLEPVAVTALWPARHREIYAQRARAVSIEKANTRPLPLHSLLYRFRVPARRKTTGGLPVQNVFELARWDVVDLHVPAVCTCIAGLCLMVLCNAALCPAPLCLSLTRLYNSRT